MKERNTSIIILFILFALPTPLSLISWIGTLISLANIGMVDWSEFSQCIQMVVGLITMLIAGAYLVTYIISLGATLKNKKITIMSFLPMLHIVLFGILVVVWMWLNEIYKV